MDVMLNGPKELEEDPKIYIANSKGEKEERSVVTG